MGVLCIRLRRRAARVQKAGAGRPCTPGVPGVTPGGICRYPWGYRSLLVVIQGLLGQLGRGAPLLPLHYDGVLETKRTLGAQKSLQASVDRWAELTLHRGRAPFGPFRPIRHFPPCPCGPFLPDPGPFQPIRHFPPCSCGSFLPDPGPFQPDGLLRTPRTESCNLIPPMQCSWPRAQSCPAHARPLRPQNTLLQSRMSQVPYCGKWLGLQSRTVQDLAMPSGASSSAGPAGLPALPGGTPANCKNGPA